MEQAEKDYVREVRSAYTPHEENKLEKLRKLDAKVHMPATVFSIIFGIVGALVLGTGMCLAMEIIGTLMPLGVAVGIVGIAMVSVNYFIYKAILRSGKKKYADEVIALSNDLLNE